MAKTQHQRRVRVPKNEHQERLERQRNQRVIEIAFAQLELAHERTQDAMDANDYEMADVYSMTTFCLARTVELRLEEATMPEKIDQRPMMAYATLLGVYGLSMLGLFIGRSKTEQQVERWTAGDVALLGAATFKLSRLMTKARVTAPLREPFVEPGASVGEGEVSDESVGHGFQKAIGELLTCPFCGSAWIAMGLTYGLILAPRLTRRAMSIATALALSDTLHLSFSTVSSIAEWLEQIAAGK